MRVRRKEWTPEEDKLLVDTVNSYHANGKSTIQGLKKASKLLKRRLTAVTPRYSRVKRAGNEPDVQAAPNVPYVKITPPREKDVVVKGGSYAMAAQTGMGMVSVSEKEIVIVWDNPNTPIKITHSKEGLVITKA